VSASNALQTKGLTRRYGDLTALGPLDLKIPAGQRVSLIGANGSGKTTLMRLVSGLLEPTEGTIEIMGEPVGTFEARAEISYIPDDPVLYDDLSVREHIEYLGPLYGATNWQEYGDELMERLGIAHRADDLPSGFSRGLRQKTSLAVGFLRPFSVLMVDEPFVGLDEPGRVALLSLLDEVAAKGCTVIVASHQLDLVGRADRCIALHDGAITYDGDPKKVDVAKLVGM
jgi:ABC-2 type transport system ATP-binding protein